MLIWILSFNTIHSCSWSIIAIELKCYGHKKLEYWFYDFDLNLVIIASPFSGDFIPDVLGYVGSKHPLNPWPPYWQCICPWLVTGLFCRFALGLVTGLWWRFAFLTGLCWRLAPPLPLTYLLAMPLPLNYLLSYVRGQQLLWPWPTYWLCLCPWPTYWAMFEASTPPRRQPHRPQRFSKSALMSVLSLSTSLQVCRASVMLRAWSSASAHHLYAPL